MKNKENSKIKKYIISSVFILALSFFVVPVFCGNFFVVYADVTSNATGWLWGGSEDANISGTIGASNGNETGVYSISVNNVDFDGNPINIGSTIPYGVNIPLTDGLLSGYAWSETLGWISFNAGDVVGCPSGVCNARREENLIKGWARILSIKKEYEKVPSNSGGWTGFIMLDGVTITPADGILHGYGWNGETVGTAPNVANGLGTISFEGVKIKVVNRLNACAGSCGVSNGASPLTLLSGLSMTNNQQKSLHACFGVGTDCKGSEVTAVWDETSDPNSVISFSSNIVTSNNTTGSGQSSSAEASYSKDGTVYKAPFKISVSASLPPPPPPPIINNSEGWKEVAP